jgi:hypothetical protein
MVTGNSLNRLAARVSRPSKIAPLFHSRVRSPKSSALEVRCEKSIERTFPTDSLSNVRRDFSESGDNGDEVVNTKSRPSQQVEGSTDEKGSVKGDTISFCRLRGSQNPTLSICDGCVPFVPLVAGPLTNFPCLAKTSSFSPH